MALDFTKLHDAIGKVADLAKSHASVSALYTTVKNDGEALLADAQKQVDDLVEQLLAAVGSPAEAHGLAAVATALTVAPAPGVTVAQPVVAPAPVVTDVAPAAPVAPVAPAAAPVAPASALSAVTFLPGDPRAPK